MADEFGGSPQDEDETEAPEGPPDPALLIAAAGGLRDDHPLFPRADGSAETRDIKFVSFCRKRTSDQAMQNCPEDIPARDVKSWAQVVEWWGGGEYKAIAKDAKHRIVAWSPNATGDWLTFDGDSKPFVLRDGKSYSTPGPTVAQPSANAPHAAAAPAPAPQDALLGMMTQVLNELRSARTTAAPTLPSADGPLVAKIQAQAAQATATSQANTQIMQTLLTVVAQRPAEPATRSAEPTTLALQLISAMQKLVPTPAAAPGLAEQIPVIKALRDLYQPAAVVPTNELQAFVDIFGQVMAADAARTQAERAQTATEPQEAPAPRPPSRPRPALVHVPGIGMVEVVAPDASALRFGDLSTEERAARGPLGTVDVPRHVSRASRQRARAPSSDRAPRADARPGTARRGSARAPARDRPASGTTPSAWSTASRRTGRACRPARPTAGERTRGGFTSPTARRRRST